MSGTDRDAAGSGGTDVPDRDRLVQGVFDSSGFGIAVTALDGMFLHANAAFIRLVERSIDELRTMRFLDITHPDDRGGNEAQFAQLLNGEHEWFSIEKRYLTGTGQVVWVEGRVSLMRDEHGAATHVVGTFADVHEAKRVEAELRRSEDLRRIAGRLARVGGWSLDPDGTTYWTEELHRILESPLGAGSPPLDAAVDMYPPGHRERIADAVQRALEHGEPFDLELEIETFSGRRLPVRAIGEPVADETGRVRQVLGAFQDVSDLWRLIERAEEIGRRLRSTFENMTDALFTLDREWNFTYLNRRAGPLLQRNVDELVGKNVWEEFPEAVGSPLYLQYHEAVDEGVAKEIEEYYYEPLDTWFRVMAYPSDDGLAVYFSDVGDQHDMRVAIRQREREMEYQAALLDAATDAIIVRDLDGIVTYWNRSAQKMYGWGAGEAIGRQIRVLLHHDADAFAAADAVVRQVGEWSGDLRVRNRRGDTITVAARWTLIDDPDRGHRVLAINSDVTEQRRLERHLNRAQRLESIGTLAGGVAHDLNNMLSPVLLAGEMLRERETDRERAELIDIVVDSTRRGADLIRQLLSFARGEDGERAEVAVGELFDRVHSIVRETFPKNVSVQLTIEDDLDPVVGDATQLQQVLLNLAVNARDAMPGGGIISCSARNVDLDAQYLASTGDGVPGRFVLIEIEDQGQGMSSAVLERAFEPFFTTKELGAGTGLGLSTSLGIVESHGGILRAYSELGKGTRVSVYLPTPATARERVDEFQPPPADASLSGEGKTVLVVDDEAAIRATTRMTLEHAGYTVVEASNGAEAVAAFAANSNVDLVLMDMMMPVMDGPAAIHALQVLTPDVRIIAASGLHGNGRASQALSAGVRHFLPKPYTSIALLTAIAQALQP